MGGSKNDLIGDETANRDHVLQVRVGHYNAE